jgi:hypothetical protein
MSTERALALLERENPVDENDLPAPDDARARLLRDRILAESAPRGRSGRRALRPWPAAGAAVAVASVVGALVLVGAPGSGSDIENAAAAVSSAAEATAASADRSGTVVVRITHDGEVWSGTTIRWNGDDVAITGFPTSSDVPQRRPKAGDELRVVDGILYGTDPELGGWIEFGSPASIDPDSGTTPAEYLAAVREDVEGVTLRRLGDDMTGLTTTRLNDGSTVYAGTVPAGQIARESGVKDGQPIRVFPFGSVAHDEAAHPAALLDTAITVGEDGLIRELAVSWGTWTYTVAYSDLGTTAAVLAPTNAKSLRQLRAVSESEQP